MQHIFTPKSENIENERAWIAKEIESIGLANVKTLARKACDARKLSYSPYSKYAVGAAVLSVSGDMELGQNIEIHTWSETTHAEEMAIKKMVSKGAVSKIGRKFIRAVAVSHSGDSAPCGRCRQIIMEFSDNAVIVVADEKGEIRNVTSTNILLPYAFKPSDLDET